jgi:nucleoside-diphosphate-sugar epimerase
VRDYLPDAEIAVTDEGDSPWTHAMDMTAARADLGYEPAYDLESGVRQYVDAVRVD